MSRQAKRFGVGVHPDLPESLVHFTGRPRGKTDRPPKFAPIGAEARLVGILQEGLIRGARSFGTSGPVICLSEPSGAAIQVMLSTGVTGRGPYEPWAVLVDRERVINVGFRPVWHISSDELLATASLPSRLKDRRVRYEPGRADWLAEREWRLCWGDETAPPPDPVFVLAGALRGVIVGKRDWRPPPGIGFRGGFEWRKYAKACHAVPRLWWNGSELVDDGVFDLNAQMAADAARDGDMA